MREVDKISITKDEKPWIQKLIMMYYIYWWLIKEIGISVPSTMANLPQSRRFDGLGSSERKIVGTRSVKKNTRGAANVSKPRYAHRLISLFNRVAVAAKTWKSRRHHFRSDAPFLPLSPARTGMRPTLTQRSISIIKRLIVILPVSFRRDSIPVFDDGACFFRV